MIVDSTDNGNNCADARPKESPDTASPTDIYNEPQTKKLILCDRVSGLEDHLSSIEGNLRFLTLVDTLDSRSVCDYLRDRPNTEELSRPQLFRERSREFWTKYVGFLGWLNVKNDSPDWWAMTFTAKSPLATPIGLNIFHFLLIVELLREKSGALVIVAESPELIAQTKKWGKRSGAEVVSLVKPPPKLRRFLTRKTPAGVLRASARTCMFWFLSRRLRWKTSSRTDSADGHLVIVTQTHPQSFSVSSAYRDSYFGPLIDHVASSRQKAVILGLMVGEPFDQLRKLKSQDFDIPIHPVESWITLKDIAACTARALRGSLRKFDPAGPIEIDGTDLSLLVGGAIQEARRSGDFFLNLLMYYCGRSLGRALNVSRCLYPYENRAWEKMLIQGLRATSPQTQIIGYQHASVAPVHANFFLGPEEGNVVPLPDSILTTGTVVQDWLESEGNYPPGIFATACALRQSQEGLDKPPERRSRTTRVLVALATNFAEHVNTVVFVEQGFRSHDGYEVRIRPHPAFSLERVVEAAPLKRRDFFTPSPGSLAEDFEWADIVLYATSTVGLEAVSLGIPALHLDLGEFLVTDPMFGWSEFKWSVGEPGRLVEAIKSIDDLPEDNYLERQKKGMEYAAAYLMPITDDALRLFSEVVAVGE